MIPLKCNYSTLPMAHNALIRQLLSTVYGVSLYEITQGSFAGEKRVEFDHVTVQITEPHLRPLIDLPRPGMPHWAPDFDPEQYLHDYLLSDIPGPDEVYTYGQWIAPALERVVRTLSTGPGTNQATISLGGWTPRHPDGAGGKVTIHTDGTMTARDFSVDTDATEDPACLRCIDWRLDQDRRLHMVLYFRSWDLWGGFPINLAGLQLLNEYVAGCLEDCRTGSIVASSKGLHLYEHAWDAARKMVGLCIVIATIAVTYICHRHASRA
jgi:thymidylate synthase